MGFKRIFGYIGNFDKLRGMHATRKSNDEFLTKLKNDIEKSTNIGIHDEILSNGMYVSDFMEKNNQPWNIVPLRSKDFTKIIEYSRRIGRLDYANGLIRKKGYKYIINHGLKLSKDTIIDLITTYPQTTIKGVLLSTEIDNETKNKLVDLYFSEEFVKRPTLLSNIIKNAFISGDKLSTIIKSMFDMFMYNDVPNFLKRFKLYQYAKNDSFSQEMDDKDKGIFSGYFRVAMESSEKSLVDMSKLLINGWQIINNEKYYKDDNFDITLLSQEEMAILLQYSDTMIGLHNVSCSINSKNDNIIERSENRIENLRNLYKCYGIIVSPAEVLTNLFSSITTDTCVTPEKILSSIDMLKSNHGKCEADEEYIYKFIDLTERKSLILFNKILKIGILPKTLNILQSNTETPEEYKDLQEDDIEVLLNGFSKEVGKKAGIYIAFSKKDVVGDDELPINLEHSKDIVEFRGTRIRSGIGSLKINHIVATTWNTELAHELAMFCIYVPVIDLKGNILFSEEDYNRIRNKEMQGLSYYGTGEFNLDPKCRNIEALIDIYRKLEGTEENINGIRSIVQGKEDSIVTIRREKIIALMKELCKRHGFRCVDGVAKNLLPNEIEIIETGSTKRGTNMPGDGDFDFAVKTSNYHICSVLNDELIRMVPDGKEEPQILDNGDLRSAKVQLPYSDETVDMDISYSPKSLTFEYSCDEAVEDRLKSIREQYPRDINYVRTNIVIAKAIMKKLGIYKKAVSDGGTPFGGMGGIGVENWILQNGGSFEQAMRTFFEKSVDKNGVILNHDEFVEQYPIYEYGNNHMTSKRDPIDKLGRPLYYPYTHINYTQYFTDEGIRACRAAFGDILKEIDSHRMQTTLSSLIRSIYNPTEIIESRPSILDSHSDIQNMMYKYGELIKTILMNKGQRTNFEWEK